MNIKVTNINKQYHARLYSDSGSVLDEMACKAKSSIGWICREMLRWQDKLGNVSAWTSNARNRQEASPSDVKYIRV